MMSIGSEKEVDKVNNYYLKKKFRKVQIKNIFPSLIKAVVSNTCRKFTKNYLLSV